MVPEEYLELSSSENTYPHVHKYTQETERGGVGGEEYLAVLFCSEVPVERLRANTGRAMLRACRKEGNWAFVALLLLHGVPSGLPGLSSLIRFPDLLGSLWDSCLLLNPCSLFGLLRIGHEISCDGRVPGQIGKRLH